MKRRKIRVQPKKTTGSRSFNFQSEQGSALILVMFVLLLLTILGISVLGAAVGGATLTETRENDVQSLHLAQKAIDEALAYIMAELNAKIEGSSTETQEAIDNDIKTFLKGLKKNAFVSGTDLQGATNGITDFIIDPNSPRGEQTVTIKANATVNGVLRTLQQKIKITTFPDFLNYSLGSEGTVYLNGAPAITGNIYAGEDLKISRVANYVHNSALTQDTLYPLLVGDADVQSFQNLQYSEDGNKYVPTTEILNGSRLDDRVKTFSDSVKIKKKSTFVQIDVEDSFLDKVVEAAGSAGNKEAYSATYKASGGKNLITSLQKKEGQGGTISSLKLPQLKDFEIPSSPEPTATPENGSGGNAVPDTEPTPAAPEDELIDEEQQQRYEEAMQQLKEKLSNLSESTIFDGNLEINGVDFNEIKDLNKITPSAQGSSWFIVNGDLTLDNYAVQAIKVQSNILVTGDLYIKGNVTFDSTMFVLGKTEVVNATITGISGKELVLISKGSILINRVEEFKDTATQLRAFFYTDSTAELYGVGSIFSLNGGFFAKGDLTINAVVDKVSQKPGYNEFDFGPQALSSIPRFVVNYNKDVFENQNVGLPRINQVKINVEPVELLQPGA